MHARSLSLLDEFVGRSFSLSRNWVLGISLHERVTHLLCLRLEFSEATLVITNFKLRKDGVVKRLPCFDQMVEDAGKFVGRVLECLRSEAKGLGHTVFGFDPWRTDAPTATHAIFRTKIEPGTETVIDRKLR